MIASVGLREWKAMLAGAIAEVTAAHAWLSELDSTCGDGDHGTTMLRAAKLLEKCIHESAGQTLQAFLESAAWALMGLDGGATGPLLGSLFLGISEATGARPELDARSLAETFEAGCGALARQSRARAGDKTMLDALLPAVQAMRQAADDGRDIGEALHSAAVAAREGAAATSNYVAKMGRARYLGEKTLGTPDPGATSIALLFKGLHQGFMTLEKEVTRC